MESAVTIVLLVIFAIAVVSAFVMYYSGIFSSSTLSSPVRASIPAGQTVYKVGNTFFIPLHFSKTDNSPIIGVCGISINYIGATGDRVDRVWFANTASQYVNSGTFTEGTVSLSKVIIDAPSDATLAIVFSNTYFNYKINSIILFYCTYGVSTNPEWSESLLIPENVLTP